MSKERYQNPVVDDTINLRLFSYNSNSKADFFEVNKVEIYYLDPNAEDKPVLVQTIAAGDINHTELGSYQIAVTLTSPNYVIGKYLDVWYVKAKEADSLTTIENKWEIYPDLWFTNTIPVVYDFNFVFRPNKIKLGSKRHLIVEITTNVPYASDLERYYQNLAIVSPIKIFIEQSCGECLPAEKDLRRIVDGELLVLREKSVAYYFLDTTDYKTGIYDIWFEMEFADSTYVSDKNQLQIYE